MGFLSFFLQNRLMGLPSQARRSRRIIALSCASAAVTLMATSLTMLANTPPTLRRVPAGGCYCRCSESHTRSGCVKMCDLPKYASRWWATSCSNPRVLAPHENRGASPRFPHPDRAEHAQNLPNGDP
jgi:hypothetical protein